jgi:hypothetical protein
MLWKGRTWNVMLSVPVLRLFGGTIELGYVLSWPVAGIPSTTTEF